MVIIVSLKMNMVIIVILNMIISTILKMHMVIISISLKMNMIISIMAVNREDGDIFTTAYLHWFKCNMWHLIAHICSCLVLPEICNS